jgi:uncharacterized protein YdhG (YjbR/CyaY superfamily)
MISKAPDVDTYIQEAEPERRPILERLRDLYRKTLAGYDECIEYGMPCYKNDGKLISFASQKQYISLYGLRSVVGEDARSVFPSSSPGKGCIRFTKPEKIDFTVLEQLLQRVRESKAGSC